VATHRVNQNRFASWLETGPVGFNMVGELPPQAAKRSEDKSTTGIIVPQCFILRNIGILTSHLLKYD
jgi:hypothetical protein